MSEIDYTKAVDDAARAYCAEIMPKEYDEYAAFQKYQIREHVLPIVVAASRDIARQVWDQALTSAAINTDSIVISDMNPYREDA